MEILIDIVKNALDLPNADIKNLGSTGGMTNLNYLVSIDSENYIVRVPGRGTEKFINRVEEKSNLELGSGLGINPKVVYFNVNTGLKITEKIKGAQKITNKNANSEEVMESVSVILRKLHDSNSAMKNDFNLFKLMDIYEELGVKAGARIFEGFYEVKEDIQILKNHYETLLIKNVPCHIDPAYSNFVLNENNKMYLIDWEYSGMFDPMWDVASYLIECEFSQVETDLFIKYYFNREATILEMERIELHIIFQDYLWSVWTRFKEEKGDDFGSYGIKRFNRVKENIELFKKQYKIK